MSACSILHPVSSGANGDVGLRCQPAQGMRRPSIACSPRSPRPEPPPAVLVRVLRCCSCGCHRARSRGRGLWRAQAKNQISLRRPTQYIIGCLSKRAHECRQSDDVATGRNCGSHMCVDAHPCVRRQEFLCCCPAVGNRRRKRHRNLGRPGDPQCWHECSL